MAWAIEYHELAVIVISVRDDEAVYRLAEQRIKP